MGGNRALPFVAVCVLLASGCGGGSGEGVSDIAPTPAEEPAAALASLQVLDGSTDESRDLLTPAFRGEFLQYTAQTDFETTEVRIVARPSDASTTVSINGQSLSTTTVSGLGVGLNAPVVIEVNAPAHRRTTYTVSLTRLPVEPVLRRALTDRLDDTPGYQIKVLYALPRDGQDNALDTNGTLVRSVTAAENWFQGQSDGKALRWDTFAGSLDVLFVRLRQSDEEIRSFGIYARDAIENEITASAWFQPRKIYAVYYGGTHGTECGAAPVPPSLVGWVGVLYLLGPCGSTPVAGSGNEPAYWEFVLLHEIFHTLGAVPTCAPHYLQAHVSDDPEDLMYSGPEVWRPSKLDVNRDDYYGHGSFCLDVKKSIFLTPPEPGALPPPGW